MKKFVRSLRFGLLAIRHTLELERIVWPQSATCLDHIAEEMKVTALLYSLVLLIVLRHRDKEPGRIQGASQAIHGGPDWL